MIVGPPESLVLRPQKILGAIGSSPVFPIGVGWGWGWGLWAAAARGGRLRAGLDPPPQGPLELGPNADMVT